MIQQNWTIFLVNGKLNHVEGTIVITVKIHDSVKHFSPVMEYTGFLKKMVIELWRAIGHSIFNIQK